MTTISLKPEEQTIVEEYARIHNLEIPVILRNGVDSIVTKAIREQIQLDVRSNSVGEDVKALFDESDYEQLVIRAKFKGIIPQSLIENMKNRKQSSGGCKNQSRLSAPQR